MNGYRNQSRAKTKRESGAVLPFAFVSLFALLAFAGWSVETGRVWQTKSQLQAAADSAALAGAGSLLSAGFTVVDEGAARTAAMTYGAQHIALGANLTIAATDVSRPEAGTWHRRLLLRSPEIQIRTWCGRFGSSRVVTTT